MNWKQRVKNPAFWAAIVAVVLSQLFAVTGTPATAISSWSALMVTIRATLSNPYALTSIAIAVAGVCVDPTTPGIGDSIKKIGEASE